MVVLAAPGMEDVGFLVDELVDFVSIGPHLLPAPVAAESGLGHPLRCLSRDDLS